MIAPARPIDATSPAQPLSAERLQLREAAQAFEAIMLRQLLAAARAGSLAQDAPLTGGALSQFQTMRDEHLADIASQSGAFGLAQSIEAQLAAHVPNKGA